MTPKLLNLYLGQYTKFWPSCTTRPKCSLFFLCIGTWLITSLANNALGQQPPKTEADILADELLKDIVPKDAAESADSQDPLREDATGGKRSFDAGQNPFEVISLGMLTASKFLREGETGSTTQNVQTNVLMRLDELIEQSEKQSKKPKSSTSSAASQRSSKRQTSRQSPPKDANQQRTNQQNQSEGGQESEKDQGEQRGNSKTDDDGETESDMPSGNGSQPPGGSKSTKAELGSAKALQQGVWGHLPERIRQQMMSRMVERFLPEYEASIEEYFRKLSDSEQEPQKP